MEFISKRYFEKLNRFREKESFLFLPKFINGSWKWFEKARWEEAFQIDDKWHLMYWID